MRRPLSLAILASLVCAPMACGARERPKPRLVDGKTVGDEAPPPAESPRPRGYEPQPGDPSEPALALLDALPDVDPQVEVVVVGSEDTAILPELESTHVGATRLFVADDRVDAMWRFAGLSQQSGPMPVGAEVFSTFELDGGAVERWRHYPCRSIIEAQTGEVRSPPGVADVSDRPPEVFTQTADAELHSAAAERVAAWGQRDFSLEGVLGAGYLLHDMGSGRRVQSQRDAEATLADAFSAFGDGLGFDAVDHRVYGAYTVTHATAAGDGHSVELVAVHRFDTGKLVETWLYLDRASLPKPSAIPSEPQIAHPPFRGG